MPASIWEQAGGLLVMLGLLASVFITGRRWEQPVYRLLPFAYATVAAVAGSWYWGKSGSELVNLVLVANVVAAGFLFAMWIESPRERKK